MGLNPQNGLATGIAGEGYSHTNLRAPMKGDSQAMSKVRLGIVGMGNIGRYHADYLLKGKVQRAELAAVCDAYAPLDHYASLKTFKDPEQLFRAGAIDAVIIATPHYQHTTLGIAALEAGLHVMIEKPISAHKADAERLIAAAEQRPKQVFARDVPAPHRAAISQDPEADSKR